MRLTVLADAASVAEAAALHIAARLRAEPALVLGLATGRTMERVHAGLARLHRDAGLSFARCRSFNLDEYAGLPPDDANAYRRTMNAGLFDLVDIALPDTHVPDGMAPDLDAEGRRYEALIAASGGIGLQVLGLGENGHIGFNEPGSAHDSRTRAVTLTPATRRQNQALFGGALDRVPRRAITMGIGTILEARGILLVATGAAKAAALARAIAGPLDRQVPASALQRHPDSIVIADAEAAARL
ncbi:glucosamine-6-phosphate deaminase [Lichenicoccus sp.]|uniref:glucosamine-6-phosphate deaminase n=1 Tax=Lichenicoccus sp. TaxID=2781899 RepID=UPI003D0D055C